MRNVGNMPKNEIAKQFGRALQVSVGYGWQKFDWDECDARNGRDVLSDTFWRSLKDELKGKCDGVTKSTGVTVNLKRLRAGHGRILWLDIFKRIKNSDLLVFDVAAAPDGTALSAAATLMLNGTAEAPYFADLSFTQSTGIWKGTLLWDFGDPLLNPVKVPFEGIMVQGEDMDGFGTYDVSAGYIPVDKNGKPQKEKTYKVKESLQVRFCRE